MILAQLFDRMRERLIPRHTRRERMLRLLYVPVLKRIMRTQRPCAVSPAGLDGNVESPAPDFSLFPDRAVPGEMPVAPPFAASRPPGNSQNNWFGPELATRLVELPAPIVVFNKSHSGSRLLAALLRQQGIFMGADLNEAFDAMPFLPVVEYVVKNYHPDFTSLWRMPHAPAELQSLLAQALDTHLQGHRPGSRWGWKLCETTFILPLLNMMFPHARYVHLLRDGRDVAFSDHVAPELPFWRKIYFGTDRVQSWHGMALDDAAYRRCSHLYNAWHWREMVGLGRAYGAMLGNRYVELHYEALSADLIATGRALLQWLGVPVDAQALATLQTKTHRRSIGKYRGQPMAAQRAVQRIIEPTLLACGYTCTPLPPHVPLLRRLARKTRLGSAWRPDKNQGAIVLR